ASKGVEVLPFNNGSQESGQLHTAVAIFDRSRVMLGSGKWTYEDFYIAREHAMLTDDPQVTAQIVNLWEDDWQLAEKATRFSVYALHS
ncbi:hypothetical protein MXD81_19495, partial [Microbacteriaceae bacterium K1510]|nr:hypothetical protein [Microbacteriaceae bacterium K1510]